MDAQRNSAPARGAPSQADRRFAAILGGVFLVGVLALSTAAAHSVPPAADASAVLASASVATTASPSGSPQAPPGGTTAANSALAASTVTVASTAAPATSNGQGADHSAPVTTNAATSTTPLAQQNAVIATVSAPPATSHPEVSPTTAAPATAAPTSTAPTAVAGTPAPTATLTEAQTPLHLTDTTTTTPLATTPAWWQTGLDITWKLGVVLGLIYLAARALALLKARGFTTIPGSGAKGAKGADPFFEKIAEMRLSAQHTIVAVRAGDRILLLAQSANALRSIAEISPDAEDVALPAEEQSIPLSELAAPHTSFARQMQSTVTDLVPVAIKDRPAPDKNRGHLQKFKPPTQRVSRFESPTNADIAATTAEDSPMDDTVVDAAWVTVESEAIVLPDTLATPDSPPAPRRGNARPLGKSPTAPLDPAREREILWYAEEHGSSATAARYGMTRQRVTALRARYERLRAERHTAQSPATANGQSGAAADHSADTAADATVEHKHTPRIGERHTTGAVGGSGIDSMARAQPATSSNPATQGSKAAPGSAALTGARASLARAVYGKQPPATPAPVVSPFADVAESTPAPRTAARQATGPRHTTTRGSTAADTMTADDGDVSSQAAQVARDLASRMGINVPSK